MKETMCKRDLSSSQCVNDDKKLLEFDIKLDVSRHFNIISVNEN